MFSRSSHVLPVILGGLCAVIGVFLLGISATPVKSLDVPCTGVDFIYARGSGEGTNSTMARKYFELAKTGAEALGLTHALYELGTGGVENYSYPARAIDPLRGYDEAKAGAGAIVSGGRSFSYGESVGIGVMELTEYVKQTIKKCPNAKFIIVGYSQGAQVVGDAYARMSDDQRKHIVFNGLMGDPKLYLPEGESRWQYEKEGDWFKRYYAVACRGNKDGLKESYYSKWRRYVPNCNTDNGLLGARVPYLPASWDYDWQGKTGLWCVADDMVCGSSITNISGHFTYGADKGVLWSAINEGLSRYARENFVYETDVFRDIFRPKKEDATSVGRDSVLLVDERVRADPYIYSALEYEANVSLDGGGRVAVGIFSRQTGALQLYLDFSSNQGDILKAFQEIRSVGEPRGGEYTVYNFRDSLPWREGARRVAYFTDYMIDAGIDATDITNLDFSRRPDADFMNHFMKSPEEMMKTLLMKSSVDDDYVPPKVITDLSKYYTSPGEAIYVDASDSYGYEAEIVRWDWDFESDGTYDITYGSNYQEHTYTKAGEYTITIRAWDSTGATTIHHVPVQVGENETIKASDYRMITSATVLKKDGKQMLVWEAINEPTGVWGIKINGMLSGAALPDARSIELDLGDNPQDYEVSIVPISTESELGETFIATNMFKKSPIVSDKEKSEQSAVVDAASSTDMPLVGSAGRLGEDTQVAERGIEEHSDLQYANGDEVLRNEEKPHKETGVAISLWPVVGGVFVVLLAIAGAIWYWRRHRVL